MKIDYDKVADAVYIRVKKGKVAKTISLKDRLIVDTDKSGNILGVEILDMSSSNDMKKFLSTVKKGIPFKIYPETANLA